MEAIMAKKEKNKNVDKIDKDNFIAFLSSMTPVEVNKLIEEKGKPPKPICPMFFYPNPND